MNRTTESVLSRVFAGLLVGAAVAGAFFFAREIPSLRRYLRIERM